MSNPVRDILKRFLIPIAASILSAVLVGGGTTILTSRMYTETLNERVNQLEKDVTGERLLTRTVSLERQIERHEKALERDFARHEQTVFELSHKTDDQEKRLTRLEALVGEMQRLLTEIRSDVKSLLAGSRK